MAEGHRRFAELQVWKDDLSHQLDLELAALCKPDLHQIFQRTRLEITPAGQ